MTEQTGWPDSSGGGSGLAFARLTVDLGALRANYRHIAAGAPRTAAVVKANGYGTGALHAFEALRAEGCRDFFVATVEEGVELRSASADPRIYVFSGPLDAGVARTMSSRNLTPVLNDESQVRRWAPYRERPVAVHVDTGMHRLGFPCDALSAGLFEGLNVCVVLSHLANADQPDDPMTDRQVERFARAATVFPDAITSLANSAGALSGVASDMTRAGIALYGGNPFAARTNPMRPAATLEARVLAVRQVGSGEPVGYGGTHTTATETCIAVLGIGYADGVPRLLSNEAQVAWQGSRVPVIGRVSMDLMHIDATKIADGISIGDWVEIFGSTVSVDETAAWAGTISYEILTRIGSRVRRTYIP